MRDGIFKYANLSRAWKKAFESTTLDAQFAAEAAVHFYNAQRDDAAEIDPVIMRRLAVRLDNSLFALDPLTDLFRVCADGRDPTPTELRSLRHAEATAADGRVTSRELTAGVATTLTERAELNIQKADIHAAKLVRRGKVAEADAGEAMARVRDTVAALDPYAMAQTVVNGKAPQYRRVEIRLNSLDSALTLGRAARSGHALGGDNE